MLRNVCCLVVFLTVFGSLKIVNAAPPVDLEKLVIENVHGGKFTEKMKEQSQEPEVDETPPRTGLFGRLKSIDNIHQNRAEVILKPLNFLERMKTTVMGKKGEDEENSGTTSSESNNGGSNTTPMDKLGNTAGELTDIIDKTNENVDETDENSEDIGETFNKIGENLVESVQETLDSVTEALIENEESLIRENSNSRSLLNKLRETANKVIKITKDEEDVDKILKIDGKSSENDEKLVENGEVSEDSTPFMNELTNTAGNLINMNKNVESDGETTDIDAETSKTDEEPSGIDKIFLTTIIELPKILKKLPILRNLESIVAESLEEGVEERQFDINNEEEENTGEGGENYEAEAGGREEEEREELKKEVEGTKEKGREEVVTERVEEVDAEKNSRIINSILNVIKKSIDGAAWGLNDRDNSKLGEKLGENFYNKPSISSFLPLDLKVFPPFYEDIDSKWNINNEIVDKVNERESTHHRSKKDLSRDVEWDINLENDDKVEDESSTQVNDDQNSKNVSKNILKRFANVYWTFLKEIFKILQEILKVYCDGKYTTGSNIDSGLSEKEKLYLSRNFGAFNLFEVGNNDLNSQMGAIRDRVASVDGKVENLRKNRSFLRRIIDIIFPRIIFNLL